MVTTWNFMQIQKLETSYTHDHLAGKMLNMTGHEYDQIKWYNSVRVLL